MSRVPVKVVIDSTHLDNQEGVERRVSALGMTIERTIREIGTIFGSVEESDIRQLQDVEGVLQARPERGFSVPPMNVRIPQ